MVVDEKVIGGREVFGEKSKKNLFVEAVRCFRIWRDLLKALKDPEAKVVHSCIPSTTLSMMREYVCALLTKLCGRKFIIHYRCTVPNTTQGKLGYWMLRHLCNVSDLIMVLNAQTVKCVQGITQKPIVLIPNFIDTSETCGERHIKSELKTVLYVGGVIEEKGCLEMIEAAKAFPEIDFRLIGKIDQEVAKAAEHMANVFLPGPTDREGVQKELEKADVFMFLSHFRGEGFSNALAEAMAAGLPCIVTDWAANADMIENKGGAVVPVQSAAEVISAIENMKSEAVRKEQSEFNIHKVREFYCSDVVLSQYVDAYESVLKK